MVLYKLTYHGDYEQRLASIVIRPGANKEATKGRHNALEQRAREKEIGHIRLQLRFDGLQKEGESDLLIFK